MNLKIVTGRSAADRQIDLKAPRTLLAVGGGALLVTAAIFSAGVQLGRFMAGPMQGQKLEQAIDEQRMDLQAVRGQLQGKVDAIASRVGTMNAHLIRLDALGRRITDLANLDRGEFDFDKPPPTGGPWIARRITNGGGGRGVRARHGALRHARSNRERIASNCPQPGGCRVHDSDRSQVRRCGPRWRALARWGGDVIRS